MASEAQLLERAAAKLDGLLARVTTGRWQVDGPWWPPGGLAVPAEMVTAGEDRAAVAIAPPDLGAGPRAAADLRYVVAMQPAVGRALVRWLQAEAERRTGPSRWALSVAREILADDGKIDGEGEGSG